MTIVSPERVFQDNLRSFRLSYGLKQHHMATLLQIKQKTYGSYEEGRAFPRPLVLLKLAFHFECEVEELLTECLESQAA